MAAAINPGHKIPNVYTKYHHFYIGYNISCNLKIEGFEESGVKTVGGESNVSANFKTTI